MKITVREINDEIKIAKRYGMNVYVTVKGIPYAIRIVRAKTVDGIECVVALGSGNRIPVSEIKSLEDR